MNIRWSCTEEISKPHQKQITLVSPKRKLKQQLFTWNEILEVVSESNTGKTEAPTFRFLDAVGAIHLILYKIWRMKLLYSEIPWLYQTKKTQFHFRYSNTKKCSYTLVLKNDAENIEIKYCLRVNQKTDRDENDPIPFQLV